MSNIIRNFVKIPKYLEEILLSPGRGFLDRKPVRRVVSCMDRILRGMGFLSLINSSSKIVFMPTIINDILSMLEIPTQSDPFIPVGK